MSERQVWPESKNFSSDFELDLACAELITEILAVHGRQEWITWGESEAAIARTSRVDALDGDARFVEALRVSEGLYTWANTPVVAGQTRYTRKVDEPSDETPVRMFALELGKLDSDEVDLAEVESSDYDWRSIALVVIELSKDEPLGKENVTLIDADTGEELDTAKQLELFSLLWAVGQELRANNFSDTSYMDTIAPVELHQDALAKYARVFHARDFIEGVDCDECESNHIVCAHNGLN